MEGFKYRVQPVEYHIGYCPTYTSTLDEAIKQRDWMEYNTGFAWEIVELTKI